MTSIAPILDQVALPVLLFRAGGRRDVEGRIGQGPTYGCEIGVVQEIIPNRRTTRIPGAPPYVRGLINVRGMIVTVLDLAARLDPEHSPAGEGDGSILLVRHGQRLVGAAVGTVLDVRMIQLEDRDGGSTAVPVVRGVGQSDDGPVIILDLDAMINQVVLS